jgi:prevent-host-death family protein
MANQTTRRKKVDKISVETARTDLKDQLDRVEHHSERLVITRYGRDAAALVPMSDLAKLEGAA